MEEGQVGDEFGWRMKPRDEHWRTCSEVDRVHAWVAWRPRKHRVSCLFFLSVLALLSPLFFSPLQASCLLFDAAVPSPVCGSRRRGHASSLSPQHACSTVQFLSSLPPSADARPSLSFSASASSAASVCPPTRPSRFSSFSRSPTIGPFVPLSFASPGQSTVLPESPSPLSPSVSAAAPSLLPSAFLLLSCLSTSPRLHAFSLPVSKRVCFPSRPWSPASAIPPLGGLPRRPSSQGFKRAAREPVNVLSFFAQKPQKDGSSTPRASRASPSGRRPRPPPAAALRNLAADRERTGDNSERETHKGENTKRDKETRERGGEKEKKAKTNEGDNKTTSDGEKKENKRRGKPKAPETPTEERLRALKASSERSGAENSGVAENRRTRVAVANEEIGEKEGRRLVGRRKQTKTTPKDGEDEGTRCELAALPREPASDTRRSGAKKQRASATRARRASALPSRKKREKGNISKNGNGSKKRTSTPRRKLPEDATCGRRSEELAKRERETSKPEKVVHLVLVESPAKAKTIEKFLRDEQALYLVRATRGHVRQLERRSGAVRVLDRDVSFAWEPVGGNVPVSRSSTSASSSSASRTAPGDAPAEGQASQERPGSACPQSTRNRRKRQLLGPAESALDGECSLLLRTIEDVLAEFGWIDTLFLCTDPDREGEAIAWHIVASLKQQTEAPEQRKGSSSPLTHLPSSPASPVASSVSADASAGSEEPSAVASGAVAGSSSRPSTLAAHGGSPASSAASSAVSGPPWPLLSRVKSVRRVRLQELTPTAVRHTLRAACEDAEKTAETKNNEATNGEKLEGEAREGEDVGGDEDEEARRPSLSERETMTLEGLNQNLVRAYLARLAIDYLAGFSLSPLLWRKLPGSKSAGRVQSAALKLLTDREEVIEAFKPQALSAVHATARFRWASPASDDNATNACPEETEDGPERPEEHEEEGEDGGRSARDAARETRREGKDLQVDDVKFPWRTEQAPQSTHGKCGQITVNLKLSVLKGKPFVAATRPLSPVSPVSSPPLSSSSLRGNAASLSEASQASPPQMSEGDEETAGEGRGHSQRGTRGGGRPGGAANPKEGDSESENCGAKEGSNEKGAAELQADRGQDASETTLVESADLEAVLKDLRRMQFNRVDLSVSFSSLKPPSPFRTATLQQAASRLLGFSPATTMRVAQTLYEGVESLGGLITYMRTDSSSVSAAAREEIRRVVASSFSPSMLANGEASAGEGDAEGQPNVTRKKTREASLFAQEAHEAIRPTNIELHPEALRRRLAAGLSPRQTGDPTKGTAGGSGEREEPEGEQSEDPQKTREMAKRAGLNDALVAVYDLIWRRTLASEMAAARRQALKISLVASAAQGLSVAEISHARDEEAETHRGELRGTEREVSSPGCTGEDTQATPDEDTKEEKGNGGAARVKAAAHGSEGETRFEAETRRIIFDGFLRVYPFGATARERMQNAESEEGQEEEETEVEDTGHDETAKLASSPAELFAFFDAYPPAAAVLNRGFQSSRRPPPRFSEASLINTLERLGIGRPSTYASVLAALYDRLYVYPTTPKKKSLSSLSFAASSSSRSPASSDTHASLSRRRGRLTPSPRGRLVAAFLQAAVPDFVNARFTASLEESLDAIAAGRDDWVRVVHAFWYDLQAKIAAAEKLHPKAVRDALEHSLAGMIFGERTPTQETEETDGKETEATAGKKNAETGHGGEKKEDGAEKARRGAKQTCAERGDDGVGCESRETEGARGKAGTARSTSSAKTPKCNSDGQAAGQPPACLDSKTELSSLSDCSSSSVPAASASASPSAPVAPDSSVSSSSVAPLSSVAASSFTSPLCPSCGEGVLKLRIHTRGIFVGCSAYPRCTYTQSVPPPQKRAKGEDSSTANALSSSKEVDA
ncbi:UNVERIFIED_CONTAM: DNA topoisomerase domain-containing protein [Hammondia hammondi]|eukprot:XP_008888550.1 DNA topoisomerase domain-containing protein [Hammondia hammondi]